MPHAVLKMTNIYNLTDGTLNQIQSYERVIGIIIMNNDGEPNFFLSINNIIHRIHNNYVSF